MGRADGQALTIDCELPQRADRGRRTVRAIVRLVGRVFVGSRLYALRFSLCEIDYRLGGPEVPVINFATGNPALLPLLRGDSRTVVGIDWRVPLDVAWQTVGHDRCVQGNLDPIALLAEPETLREMTVDVLQRAGGRAGHIFNLGHGILPQTPVDHARALVDMVHELSQK